MFIPTGTDGIGDKEWKLEVPVIVGWERGRTSIRAFAAYGISFESSNNNLGFGTVAEYDVTDRLALGAEISGDIPMAHDAGYELSGDLGFTYDLGQDFALQARFSHTLHTPGGVARKGLAVFIEKAF